MQPDSELQQLYKSSRNPVQEQRFQELLKQQGLTGADVGQGGNGADASGVSSGNLQGIQANKVYQQQSQQAIGGLQTQKASLADQYSDLLKTVKGQYDPLINQETATAQSALAKRGLTPDSQLYQQQVQGALQPVYGAQAANAQQIGQGSINDQNTLAQAIAQLQQGGAQFGATLPLQYGSLALQQQALPSQINLAQNQANQAKYITIPNIGVYDTTSGRVISSTGLSSTGRTLVGQY